MAYKRGKCKWEFTDNLLAAFNTTQRVCSLLMHFCGSGAHIKHSTKETSCAQLCHTHVGAFYFCSWSSERRHNGNVTMTSIACVRGITRCLTPVQLCTCEQTRLQYVWLYIWFAIKMQWAQATAIITFYSEINTVEKNETNCSDVSLFVWMP